MDYIWAYQGLSEMGAYISATLGYSKSYESISDAKRNNTTAKRIGNDIVNNIYNTDGGDLIIAPLKASLGATGGVKTGVTVRDIVQGASAYSSTVKATYGITFWDDLIKAVIDLCGLKIVANEEIVLDEISESVIGSRSDRSSLLTNAPVKTDSAYASADLCQEIANHLSELGYFNFGVNVNSDVEVGKIPFTTFANPYDVMIDCAYTCLRQDGMEEWRDRGVSFNQMFNMIRELIRQDGYADYNAWDINISWSRSAPAQISMTITLANYLGGQAIDALYEDDGSKVYSFSASEQLRGPSYGAIVRWHGGTRTLEYEASRGIFALFGEDIGYQTTDNNYYHIASRSNVCSTYMKKENVDVKDPGYVVPTADNHDLVTIYPWLNDTAISLPGVLGDVFLALRYLTLALDKDKIRALTLDRVSAIDWDDAESVDPDTPLNPEPGDPPYIPDPFIPDFPVYNANKLFTVHTIDDSNMNTLGAYLWSSNFASLIEHMFSEPIHAVLGLQELHYGGNIATGGSEEIKLGAFGSGAHGNVVTNRYITFSCGSIAVNEYYGNVTDYRGYTSASLYLPYIGYQNIDINEIMGKTIKIDYGIDVYTGGCVARVYSVSGNNSTELYNFYGQCGCQLPVTSADYTGMITSALRGVVGGAITGGAIGAIGGGLMGAVGSKVSYGRSNGFNNNVGAMSRQKPLLVLERPRSFYANSYNHYYGHPTNWTVSLSQCHGYTRVKDIHLDTLKATDNEKMEIERLLKEGVIL